MSWLIAGIAIGIVIGFLAPFREESEEEFLKADREKEESDDVT